MGILQETERLQVMGKDALYPLSLSGFCGRVVWFGDLCVCRSIAKKSGSRFLYFILRNLTDLRSERSRIR